MTKVEFFKCGDDFYGFSLKGHTGYADYGKDIVCASLSSIAQNTVLGLTQVLGLNCVVERSDKKGILTLRLPKVMDKDKFASAQVLIKSMYLSISQIEKGYPSNITMEVKNYDV